MKKHHLWAITAITGVVLVGLIAAAASARVSSPAKQAASIKSVRAAAGHHNVDALHAVRRPVPEGRLQESRSAGV